MSTTLQKITTLLETHQGEYTYIAIYLMINQLGYSPVQALQKVPFVETREGGQTQGFTWKLYLGAMELEYKVEERYIPYMGGEVAIARLLRVEQQGHYEIAPALATYLAVEGEQSKEDIQQRIYEDYYQLIPQLWAWLDNPLEALL